MRLDLCSTSGGSCRAYLGSRVELALTVLLLFRISCRGFFINSYYANMRAVQ